MRSSDVVFAAAIASLACAGRASADSIEGFAVERLNTAAPGASWFVNDDLAMHGGFGGTVAVTAGYAHAPLRVSDASPRLPVVSSEAFVDVGVAIGFDRVRAYVNFTSPVWLRGESGTVNDRAYASPHVDIGTNPDTFSDLRLGADVRLLGTPTSAFKLGLGAQLFVPSGERADYVSDGTYRGMVRLLFAGDVGVFRYAGHLGAHIRPLDDGAPSGPRGSEALFGAAAGYRVVLGTADKTAIVIGPEIFGETAFRALFGNSSTGLEALLTGRFEHGADHGESGPLLRVKIGAGGGLHADFGAPEWRTVLAVEVSDRWR